MSPTTCQFVAYIGHRIERNFKQCADYYGHTGPHATNLGGVPYVLSPSCAIRDAHGNPIDNRLGTSILAS